MRYENILKKLSSAYFLLFWFAGNVGIIRAIEVFLPPGFSHFTSLLVICLSVAACCYSIVRPQAESEEELQKSKLKISQLEAVINEAVEKRDFSPLIPLCDPEWLTYTKKTAYAWERHRRDMESYHQAKDVKERSGYLDSLENSSPPDTE